LITRNEKEYDKLVFLGDYVDDWWISDERIKEALADIIFYAEYRGSDTVKIAYWQSRLPIHQPKIATTEVPGLEKKHTQNCTNSSRTILTYLASHTK